ncbi:MAG: N-acetylneuraminate synthase [Lachnospiraceae bacterium]|nr:N-acetylneuraminate synthase [Lachnospiraceae bacterium]
MSKIFIIAEAGVNHNGDIEIAKKLIESASQAGADAVKFQTFQADKLVCRKAEKAEYQLKNTQSDESQFDMLKKLELTEEMHRQLIDECWKRKIQFLSTPFDLDSISLLEKMGMQTYKIPSGEITNYPYLCKIGNMHKKVILSTGMCEMDEIKQAVRVLGEHGTTDIILLHCNTEYPTPMQDVNLRAMYTLREELGLPVGYSDHTQGIEVPIAAAAMGAVVIEKHFTLDRNMEGPDHRASLEPEELRAMVQAIRNIEVALGDGIKRPSASEIKNRDVARKSIVAKTNIRKGEVFTEANLTAKRPGTGISPMQWNHVIGLKADKDYEPDEMISHYCVNVNWLAI